VISRRNPVIARRKLVIARRNPVIARRKLVIARRNPVIARRKLVIARRKLVIARRKLVILGRKLVHQELMHDRQRPIVRVDHAVGYTVAPERRPMHHIALKMLVGDRAKYLDIIMGLTFASLLITQ
jgi:hypothetical protein